MMKMTKHVLLVLTMALFIWQPAIAKANPDDYKVILTLNDGTVIEGFLKGDIMGDKIKVSEKFKGNSKKYATTDIKSLVEVNPVNFILNELADDLCSFFIL